MTIEFGEFFMKFLIIFSDKNRQNECKQILRFFFSNFLPWKHRWKIRIRSWSYENRQFDTKLTLPFWVLGMKERKISDSLTMMMTFLNMTHLILLQDQKFFLNSLQWNPFLQFRDFFNTISPFLTEMTSELKQFLI